MGCCGTQKQKPDQQTFSNIKQPEQPSQNKTTDKKDLLQQYFPGIYQNTETQQSPQIDIDQQLENNIKASNHSSQIPYEPQPHIYQSIPQEQHYQNDLSNKTSPKDTPNNTPNYTRASQSGNTGSIPSDFLQGIELSEKEHEEFQKITQKITACKRSIVLFQDIKIMNQIGQGGFGNVYKATVKHRERAIKILKKHQCDEKDLKDQKLNFLRETRQMLQITSEKIVMMTGISMDQELCIIMELVDGFSLYELLYKMNIQLSCRQIFDLALQLCEAMIDLHEIQTPILHRDLKPQNILLSERKEMGGFQVEEHKKYNLKLTDLGISRVMQKIDQQFYLETKSNNVGTASYMAPECFYEENILTKKSDVWSFGLILNEMFRNKPQYGNKSCALILATLVRQDKIEIDGRLRGDLKNLLIECLDYDPEIRPSFIEIKNRIQEIDAKCDIDLRSIFEE